MPWSAITEASWSACSPSPRESTGANPKLTTHRWPSSIRTMLATTSGWLRWLLCRLGLLLLWTEDASENVASTSSAKLFLMMDGDLLSLIHFILRASASTASLLEVVKLEADDSSESGDISRTAAGGALAFATSKGDFATFAAVCSAASMAMACTDALLRAWADGGDAHSPAAACSAGDRCGCVLDCGVFSGDPGPGEPQGERRPAMDSTAVGRGLAATPRATPPLGIAAMLCRRPAPPTTPPPGTTVMLCLRPD
mmetsp:Transcript_35643/g.93210  ORF Transcript_35643/g.93210 Transcript_35643/m.93210 type:complete len:255 (-) Transcript_35643:97-861(-)